MTELKTKQNKTRPKYSIIIFLPRMLYMYQQQSEFFKFNLGKNIKNSHLVLGTFQRRMSVFHELVPCILFHCFLVVDWCMIDYVLEFHHHKSRYI